MKTKLINIPGRGKVLCRALKEKELRQKGDVYFTYEGEIRPELSIGKKQLSPKEAGFAIPLQSWRPISPLPKKPRKMSGDNAIKAWGFKNLKNSKTWCCISTAELKPIRGMIPIEIIIRRKK